MTTKKALIHIALLLAVIVVAAPAVEDDPLAWPGVTTGYSSEFNFTSPWSEFSMFFSDNLSESSFATYSEYYFSGSSSVVDGLVSDPVGFSILGNEPAQLYFGPEPVTYAAYRTSARNANELWIEGATSWRQHVVCPQGSWLRLVARTLEDGKADFYQISQTSPDDTHLSYKQYGFYPGYNTMSFLAEEVGRQIILFVSNGQPSNAVVVDVIQTPGPSAAAAAQPYSSPYSMQYPTQTVQTPPSPPSPSSGDTPVVIQTTLTGYDVFVDGAHIGREGTGGDAPDGKFSFRVEGGREHFIRINDGEFDYGKRIYFNRGETKIINVPPGTALYI